jgi:hypothetical protein
MAGQAFLTRNLITQNMALSAIGDSLKLCVRIRKNTGRKLGRQGAQRVNKT